MAHMTTRLGTQGFGGFRVYGLTVPSYHCILSHGSGFRLNLSS